MEIVEQSERNQFRDSDIPHDTETTSTNDQNRQEEYDFRKTHAVLKMTIMGGKIILKIILKLGKITYLKRMFGMQVHPKIVSRILMR